jgi:hypothetical protein
MRRSILIIVQGGLKKDGRLSKMFHMEPLSLFYKTIPYPQDNVHWTFAANRQILEEGI